MRHRSVNRATQNRGAVVLTPSVDHAETEKEKHTHCYCRELRFDRHTVFRIGGKSFFLKVVVAIVC